MDQFIYDQWYYSIIKWWSVIQWRLRIYYTNVSKITLYTVTDFFGSYIACSCLYCFRVGRWIISSLCASLIGLPIILQTNHIWPFNFYDLTFCLLKEIKCLCPFKHKPFPMSPPYPTCIYFYQSTEGTLLHLFTCLSHITRLLIPWSYSLFNSWFLKYNFYSFLHAFISYLLAA